MSLISHHLFTNSLPSSYCSLFFTTTSTHRNPNHPFLSPPITFRNFLCISCKPTLTYNFCHSLKPCCSINSSSLAPQPHENFNLDSVLSVVKLLCLLSCTIITAAFVVNYLILGSKALLGLVGKGVLVGGVAAFWGLKCRRWWEGKGSDG